MSKLNPLSQQQLSELSGFFGPLPFLDKALDKALDVPLIKEKTPKKLYTGKRKDVTLDPLPSPKLRAAVYTPAAETSADNPPPVLFHTLQSEYEVFKAAKAHQRLLSELEVQRAREAEEVEQERLRLEIEWWKNAIQERDANLRACAAAEPLGRCTVVSDELHSREGLERWWIESWQSVRFTFTIHNKILPLWRQFERIRLSNEEVKHRIALVTMASSCLVNVHQAFKVELSDLRDGLRHIDDMHAVLRREIAASEKVYLGSTKSLRFTDALRGRVQEELAARASIELAEKQRRIDLHMREMAMRERAEEMTKLMANQVSALGTEELDRASWQREEYINRRELVQLNNSILNNKIKMSVDKEQEVERAAREREISRKLQQEYEGWKKLNYSGLYDAAKVLSDSESLKRHIIATCEDTARSELMYSCEVRASPMKQQSKRIATLAKAWGDILTEEEIHRMDILNEELNIFCMFLKEWKSSFQNASKPRKAAPPSSPPAAPVPQPSQTERARFADLNSNGIKLFKGVSMLEASGQSFPLLSLLKPAWPKYTTSEGSKERVSALVIQAFFKLQRNKMRKYKKYIQEKTLEDVILIQSLVRRFLVVRRLRRPRPLSGEVAVQEYIREAM